MRSANGSATSEATGTGWYGEPFQHFPGTLPASPQVTSRLRISAVGRWIEPARRATRRDCWPSDILPSMVRSTEITHDGRLVTSGRPIASTISPRWGWTTISRTDCDAACAWYSSPLTTWR